MADPRKAPFRFWSFFFSLKGRVSRRPFLAFALTTRLGMLAAVQGEQHFLIPASVGHYQWMGLFGFAVGLFSLAVLWPNFALMFKRFHDAGTTGLWALLYFTPFAYAIYRTYHTFSLLLRHIHTVSTSPPYDLWILAGINYGLVLIAVALPGAATSNRFGPRPGYPPDAAQDVF